MLQTAINALSEQLLALYMANYNHMLLIIDNSGRVVWTSKRQNTMRMADISRYLFDKNIADLYEMSWEELLTDAYGIKSIREISGTLKGKDPNEISLAVFNTHRFPSRNTFEPRFIEFDMVTDMPYSYLGILKLIDGYYAGLVTFQFFFRNASLGNYEDISLIVDEENRLQGFNKVFSSYFPEDSTPVLGEYLENYITEENRAEAQPKTLENSGEVLFRYPSTMPEMNVSELFSETADGIYCNASAGPAFLRLDSPADFFSYDYTLVIESSQITGEPPICIFHGTKLDKYYFPDSNGFLLGPRSMFMDAANHKKIYIFKMHGELRSLFSGIIVPYPYPNNKVKYEIRKTGLLLSLRVNNIEVGTASITPEQASSTDRSVIVGFRQGQSGMINSVTLHRFPFSGKSGHKTTRVVKLKSSTDNYFAVRSYYVSPSRTTYFQYLRLEDLSARQKVLHLMEQNKHHIDEIRNLRQQLGKLPRLAGHSKPMIKLREQLVAMAASDASIVLLGETGVGKSFIAELIHSDSRRSSGPFIKVDCSSLPPTLIESELFGHEKGAFTGADRLRHGKFEQANGGTIFLDEISELTPQLQAKLLTVLQDRKITRLGGNREIKLDLRILAATNADLKKSVRAGIFREDLYYRLNAISCFIPPLRDRIEDIPELCELFLGTFGKKERCIKSISADAYKKLQSYGWPGNIRELHNVLLEAVTFCNESILSSDHINLPKIDSSEHDNNAPLARRNKRLSINRIREELRKCEGNLSWAAHNLGVSRMGIYKKMKKSGINPEDFRDQ